MAKKTTNKKNSKKSKRSVSLQDREQKSKKSDSKAKSMASRKPQVRAPKLPHQQPRAA